MQLFMAGAGILGSKSKKTGFTENELFCGLQDSDFIQYAFWPFLLKSVSLFHSFLVFFLASFFSLSIPISPISFFYSSFFHFSQSPPFLSSRSELAVASISPQETEADYESDFELDKVNQTILDKVVEHPHNWNCVSLVHRVVLLLIFFTPAGNRWWGPEAKVNRVKTER